MQTLRTLSISNDACSTSMEIISIRLVHVDNFLESPLGVVILDHKIWNSLYLPGFRNLMQEQLSHILPPKYEFCTAGRYPLVQSQEQSIKAFQIAENSKISIIAAYDKPKIIVKDELQVRRFGFVNCSYTDRLTVLRQEISENIPDLESDSLTFQILCNDKTPVQFEKESQLTVVEAVAGGFVHIRRVTRTDSINAYTLPSKRKFHGSLEVSRIKNLRLSFSSSKDASRQSNTDLPVVSRDATEQGKPLLISYVRAEAFEHALNLKKRLTELGFSVYLDVHEIKSGLDWQDSLNYAVSNCEVFLPLVTPRYGETQWTNREVKLADLLGKAILPISFLEEWPPRCLAIQFATTQYISWKTPQQRSEELASGKGEMANDIQHWDMKYISFVSRAIEKRINGLHLECLSKPAISRMKTLRKTFPGRLPDSAAAPMWSMQESEDSNTGPDVVICAHPDQAGFAKTIKLWLEEMKYSAWIASNNSTSDYFNGDDSDVFISSQGLFPPNGSASSVCPLSGGESLTKSNTFTFSPSTMMSDSCPFESPLPVPSSLHQAFQEATDRAFLVIVIVSQAFVSSKVCRQQVYYCEQRKQILVVKFDDVSIPYWLSLLIRSRTFEDANRPFFQKTLLSRVKRLLDPTGKKCLESESHEAKLSLAIKHVRNALPLPIQNCVYVTGTGDVADPRTEEICRAIGKQLANLDNIVVVTGGTFGAGDVIGRTMHEETQRQFKHSPVWHVLPEIDPQDVSIKYNQNTDGTFPMLEYGKTLFCGNSVYEKESIVGRCFQICILIRGACQSSHQVEEFVWNDHIVVPVCGADGLDSCFPDKISQLPTGISMEDWKYLSDKKASYHNISLAVSRIISTLSQRLEASNNNGKEALPFMPSVRKKSVNSAPIIVDRSPSSTKTLFDSKHDLISRLQSVDSVRTTKQGF